MNDIMNINDVNDYICRATPVTPTDNVKAYWGKTDWNEYRLVNGTEIKDFDSYEALYAFCQFRHINAEQV